MSDPFESNADEPSPGEPDGVEPGADETFDTDVSAPATLDADIVRAIEAIVLVATEPVPVDQLAQLLEQPAAVVEELCAGLAAAYAHAGHGFQFVKVAGGWHYQTHAEMSPYVERYLLDGQRARMSGAALETLAIVAYKQPISRAQIASIRGVDPDGVLRTLVARGYAAQVAIDPGPGQAVLFGTTPQFLDKLGLNSLSDLPPLAEFVPGAEVVEALEHGLRAPDADPKQLRANTPSLPA
ncbi:MAG: scpB, partial [Acidimicrobiales bacterium]|nr:scpB [Acidimicrobiales bacterium]